MRVSVWVGDPFISSSRISAHSRGFWCASARWPQKPCFQFALRRRSSPSAVRGSVLLLRDLRTGSRYLATHPSVLRSSPSPSPRTGASKFGTCEQSIRRWTACRVILHIINTGRCFARLPWILAPELSGISGGADDGGTASKSSFRQKRRLYRLGSRLRGEGVSLSGKRIASPRAPLWSGHSCRP